MEAQKTLDALKLGLRIRIREIDQEIKDMKEKNEGNTERIIEEMLNRNPFSMRVFQLKSELHTTKEIMKQISFSTE